MRQGRLENVRTKLKMTFFFKRFLRKRKQFPQERMS